MALLMAVAIFAFPVLGASPAAAAEGDALSGAVIAGGAPLEGASVHVYRAEALIREGSATTGPDGTYSLASLPVGSYKVWIQPNEAGYPNQWHGGTSFQSAAAIDVNGATSQDFTVTGSFRLSGAVTAGGASLAGATVHVYDADALKRRASVTSAADGTYALASLPEGSYKLWVQPNEAGIANQWVGGAGFDTATAIAVTGPTTQNVALTVSSGLSGAVTAGGAGLAGATVHVYLADTLKRQASATTAADGTYALASLPEGSYKLWVQPNEAGFANQWVDGSSFENAAPVQVAGNTTRDIAVSGKFRLSGAVTAAGGGLEGATVHVYLADTLKWTASATSAADGRYSLASLPAGSYKLWVQPNEQGLANQWVGGSSFQTAAPVQVSRDTTHDVALTGAYGLSGVVTAADAGLAGATVHVYLADTLKWKASATSAADGTYAVASLPEGSYKLWVQPNEPGFANQWHGGSGFAAATTVQVSGPTTQNLVLAGAAAPNLPPAAPAGLDHQLSRDAVVLTWTAGAEADIAGYRVYRTAPGAAAVLISGDTPVADATFADSTAPVGVQHTYAVKAVDAAGQESPLSTEVTAQRYVFDVVVDPSATADATTATTVQGGIDLIPSAKDYSAAPKSILVMPGTYTEAVAGGNRAGINLIGATGDPADVVVTQGVSNTPTFNNSGNNWTVESVTIQHTGAVAAGNSTAIQTNRDRVVFRDVRALGGKRAIQPTSGGPGQTARVYFVDSVIEGASDAILGRGTAVFDRVTFRLLNGTQDFTDASHVDSLPFGFLITDSRIVTDSTTPTMFLGRAYFDSSTLATSSSQVTIRDTELGAGVSVDQPWRDFTGGTGTNTWTTERFFEFNNSGPGATVNDNRPQLTTTQAAEWTKWDYLRGTDGWNPTGTEEPPADLVAPTAPTALTATGADRAIELDWADSTEADLAGYTVWRATGDGELQPITTELVTASTFRDPAVVSGTEYRYAVTATDASGNESLQSSVATAVPSGLVLPEHDVLVDPADADAHATIQAAVDAAPAGTAGDPTVILVMPGTYDERVTISRNNITLKGATAVATDTVITRGQHQNETGAVDLNATMVVKGNDVRVENLTVVNSYDETLGSNQALALNTTGDRLVFANTRFIGDQDTIKVDSRTVFTAARAYFVDSYIEGDVDFIYGRGTAVIDSSEIFAATRGSGSNNGYLTAASTSTASTYGFLITDSVVNSDAPDDTFHLGRPWRAWTDNTQTDDGGATYANSRGQVTVRNTVLDGAIKTTSPWTGMNPNLWTDGRFSEFANTGDGAATAGDPTRPQLTVAEAADYTKWDYLAGADGWNPTGATEPVVDVVAPDALTGVTVTASTTDTTVSLNWDDSAAADLAGYRVERAGSADGLFLPITDALLTASELVDTSAAAGSTAFYRVSAVDTTGNASVPATGSVTVFGTPLPAHDLLVDHTGAAGAYTTVQAAVDAAAAGTAENPTVILIKPGDYRERVNLAKPYVVLQGSTGVASDVRIVYDLPSSAINPDTGTAYGSAATTVWLRSQATGVVVQDLTLENDYDEANGSSQALALQTQADRGVFRNVRLLSDQDTALFNSSNESVIARSYVVDSYIEGDVDFIYGRGTVVVDKTTIHLSTRGSTTNNGYMLAPSTSLANEFGVLITDSTITSDAPDKSFYLGRPWRPDGQAVIRDTVLPAAVRDDAWTDMSGNAWRDARFFEFNNSGPGAVAGDSRPQLSIEQAQRYTRWTYLAGTDGWNPTGTEAPKTDMVAPDAVTGLVATANETGTVSLTWQASAAADLGGYRVYRSTSSTVALTAENLLTGTELAATEYLDRGLVAGTTYHYVVTAVDLAANESAASSSASVTATEPTIPAHDLLVDPTGADGAYTTVQAAITAAGAGTAADPKVIAILPGTYRETIALENPYVELVGSTGDATDVVIDYDNGSETINPATGAKYGTSGSRTVYVKAGDVTMRDLTVSNSFNEATGGDFSANAMTTEGDRLVFRNVRVLGNKNTLQVSTRSGTDASVLGRAYFVDSYIEGDVDTVFGRGTAVLDRTEVHITDRVSTPYVFAPKTFTANAYGFLLTDSTVTSGTSLYLGRPWQPDATTFQGQVLVRDTVLPATVRATPWRSSSSGQDWKTFARFAEYNNSGAGAGAAGADRPMLSAAEAAGVTKWDYLEGNDGWNPTGQVAPDAGDVEAPGAPTAVSASFDASTTSTVQLSWTASQASDTKGYLVYRGFDADGTIWSQLTAQPISATTFTDANAGRGLETHYRVVAVDFVGNVSDAGTASVLVPAGEPDGDVSVFVAGDSTAADYDTDRAPRAGWGQALPLYLDENVTVRNFAQSGRSTKTFMAEGWLDKIWAEIQPGDYLLVSFAHNDEDDDPAKFVPLGDVETPGTFQYNLQLFIDGAKARGAHPVIVASVERRKFATVNGVETGPALKTHKGYPEAAIELATSQDVPALDLTSASLAKFTELGPETTKQWFMHLPVGTPNWEAGIVDNTHFQATGAIGVARMVANLMDTSGAWPAGVYTRRLGTDVPVSELTWR